MNSLSYLDPDKKKLILLSNKLSPSSEWHSTKSTLDSWNIASLTSWANQSGIFKTSSRPLQNRSEIFRCSCTTLVRVSEGGADDKYLSITSNITRCRLDQSKHNYGPKSSIFSAFDKFARGNCGTPFDRVRLVVRRLEMCRSMARKTRYRQSSRDTSAIHERCRRAWIKRLHASNWEWPTKKDFHTKTIVSSMILNRFSPTGFCRVFASYVSIYARGKRSQAYSPNQVRLNSLDWSLNGKTPAMAIEILQCTRCVELSRVDRRGAVGWMVRASRRQGERSSGERWCAAPSIHF